MIETRDHRIKDHCILKHQEKGDLSNLMISPKHKCITKETNSSLRDSMTGTYKFITRMGLEET